MMKNILITRDLLKPTNEVVGEFNNIIYHSIYFDETHLSDNWKEGEYTCNIVMHHKNSTNVNLWIHIDEKDNNFTHDFSDPDKLPLYKLSEFTDQWSALIECLRKVFPAKLFNVYSKAYEIMTEDYIMRKKLKRMDRVCCCGCKNIIE